MLSLVDNDTLCSVTNSRGNGVSPSGVVNGKRRLSSDSTDPKIVFRVKFPLNPRKRLLNVFRWPVNVAEPFTFFFCAPTARRVTYFPSRRQACILRQWTYGARCYCFFFFLRVIFFFYCSRTPNYSFSLFLLSSPVAKNDIAGTIHNKISTA